MSTMNEKIRKLMALADHPGTGAEESAAAAAMAAELALKYNIDLALARHVAEPKQFERGAAAVTAAGGNRAALLWLAGAVANLYGSKNLVWQNHTSKCGIDFIGQPHNVAMCDSWMRYLWGACKKSDTAFRKSQIYASKPDEYRASMSFRLHFAITVANRLADKLASLKRGEAAGTGTALMVVAWFETEKKEVAEWMAANLKTKTAKVASRRAMDSDASTAGREAGRNASLADPKLRQLSR